VHISFLTHAKGRYFWWSAALTLLCLTAYIVHDPKQPPNGGTWLGYTLGTIGALMIVWLAYLGRRKRNFDKGWGTVRGWVSAHVYFGASLIIIGTLHTGFQMGWNIHSLAYVLMCLVILSGLFGVWAYRLYPSERNELKKSQTMDDIFLQLGEVDALMVRLGSEAGNVVRGVVSSAIERTVIGGGYIDQLFGRDKSKVIIDGNVMANVAQQKALDYLVQLLTRTRGEDSARLAEIVREFGTRKRLLDTIREDIRMQGMIQVWLLFHIPLTFALFAALIAHIYAVFVYW
jgi:hypothetical protein